MTRWTLVATAGIVLGAGGLVTGQHGEKHSSVRTLAVRDVVEKLERQADLAAEGLERALQREIWLRGGRQLTALAGAADQAGALEETRRLQATSLEVALRRDRDVERIAPLRELTQRERDRCSGQQLDLTLAAVLPELGERT